jgi:hypothetical protein
MASEMGNTPAPHAMLNSFDRKPDPMTHLFSKPLAGISGQRIVDAWDNQFESERPVTLCTVGCLSLQARCLWDTNPSIEPGSEQEESPNFWQAVGIEVAICLYGDVLARESLWGIWMYLGGEQFKPAGYDFAGIVSETVTDLAAECCARLGVAIAQRLDRLQSAADLVAHNGVRPGSHVSVGV